MRGSTTNATPPAWILASRDASVVRIFGLSPAARLRRALEAAQCPRVCAAGGEGPLEVPATGPVVLLRGDAVYDDRLIAALLRARDTVLLAPPRGSAIARPVAACVEGPRSEEMFSLLSGTPTEAPRRVPNDLHARTAGELAPAYIAKLRKTEPPYLFFPVVEADAARIEEHAFRASYKGLTDLITRWVWPVPALATVRVLARRGVHPNTVTLLSWALAALTFVWFWQGSFGLGLAAAWLMTFLDTVDGKLARCTLTSSRLGDVLDHGLDLTHPPFWWFAWGFGLPAGVGLATVITVAGYFIGRALEGIFLAAFKFETHSWREIDGLFRTVTARRNPNLLLLSVGVLGGRPDLGMKMVAIWTVVSIAFHGWRLGLAFAERARGAEIRPFGEAPELPMRQSRAGAESGVGMSRL